LILQGWTQFGVWTWILLWVQIFILYLIFNHLLKLSTMFISCLVLIFILSTKCVPKTLHNQMAVYLFSSHALSLIQNQTYDSQPFMICFQLEILSNEVTLDNSSIFHLFDRFCTLEWKLHNFQCTILMTMKFGGDVIH